jgi:hypothetical protein
MALAGGVRMDWEQLKRDLWLSDGERGDPTCAEAVLAAAWSELVDTVAGRCREIERDTGVAIALEPIARAVDAAGWRGLTLQRGEHAVVVYLSREPARFFVLPVPAYARRAFNQPVVATMLCGIWPAAGGFTLRSETGARVTADEVAFTVLALLVELAMPNARPRSSGRAAA